MHHASLGCGDRIHSYSTKWKSQTWLHTHCSHVEHLMSSVWQTGEYWYATSIGFLSQICLFDKKGYFPMTQRLHVASTHNRSSKNNNNLTLHCHRVHGLETASRYEKVVSWRDVCSNRKRWQTLLAAADHPDTTTIMTILSSIVWLFMLLYSRLYIIL